MAAVHDGGIRQHEQLPLDALAEGLEVPARKVGTADGPGEQHVAGEHDAVPHETHAPGGMARGMAHREHALPHPHGRPEVGCMFTVSAEEHTSELQSASNLVCRLLLETKKTPEK